MRIVQISEETYRTNPATVAESRAKHQEILDRLNAPIELGKCTKTAYDAKTGAYTGAFRQDSLTSAVLKLTDDVAEFVTRHQALGGYWRGRMEAGVLVEVFLIQL